MKVKRIEYWFIFILCALCTLALQSEPLAPPPSILTEEKQPPVLHGWIGIRKYIPDLEAYEQNGQLVYQSLENHSWTYDVGTILALYDSKIFRFDLSARLMFQSALSPYGFWNFLSSAFLSDLKPSFSFFTDIGSWYGYFRHSCKHDLDQSRRMIMHQGFGIGFRSPVLINHLSDTFLPKGQFCLEGEINLPAAFPDQPTERYRWGIRSQLQWDLIQLSSDVVLFTRFRAVLLGNEDGGSYSPVEFDYQLMLALRIKLQENYLTLYVEQEKISDPWISYGNNSVHLFSFGIIADGLFH